MELLLLSAHTLILGYVSGLFLLLLVYLFYLQIGRFEVEVQEMRALEGEALRLAHLHRLIGAPDVKILLDRPVARKRLFKEWSRSVREDVAQMLGGERRSARTLLLAALFFASYFLLRTKATLSCGRRDIHFLVGLELAVFRSRN